MEGLYLYCVREKTEGYPAISMKGIDGKGEVFTLPYRELEAVVSKVSLEEFASEEIRKKAQEDLNWIKEKAIAHEKVVEEAMLKNAPPLAGRVSLIPMGFGTIFKDEVTLRETLDNDYPRIIEVLDKLRGKQEWSVKVYLKHRDKFVQEIREKNEAIKEKEKEMVGLPEGMAFFMEEELKEVISKQSAKELNSIADAILESFRKHAVASIKCKILEKELTGKQEPMVLNAAYLISEEKIENFKKEADDLNQKFQAMGFCLEYSGPWPAYNFV